MNSGNIFTELKRRNVYKVAIAYAIVAWLLIQAASILFPTFEAPAWVMKVFVTAIILGFPVALIFAWAFEITPEGIKRAEDVSPNESITRYTGRKLVWITVALAIIAAGLFAFQLLRSKPAATAASPTTSAPSGAAAIPEKSIAVLPFENLSDEKQNAFFTDGVQDEILTDLAKIADLKVISRTSVMQYKSGAQRNLREIGQQLGVAHLLEGSVQRAANRVRVNAQLIDARSDAHLWAQTYDRDLADVFAIQSEIAKAIADQLQAKLSPSEKSAIEQRPTSDVAAFDLYSRAKTLLLNTSFSAIAGKNMLQAVDLLNQAVARDSSFFEAYGQLAIVNGNLYFLNIDHTPARLALAEGALAQAARLRPDAGETHLTRAEILYRGHLDYTGALAEIELARKTLPNDARVFELTAYILRRQGKYEDGLRNLQRAIEIDPRNFFTLQQIALMYLTLRRYPEEIAVLDRALAIKPDDVETRATRALVMFDWKADAKPMHQAIDEIRAKNPGELAQIADSWFLITLADRDLAAAEAALAALGDNSWGDNAMQFSSLLGRALIARMTNDQSKAQAAFAAARMEQEKILQSQASYGPAVCTLGIIDAGLGHKQEALQEAQRAMELLPVAKDSLNGADLIQFAAVIAAWVGEKDLALQQLAKAAQLPGTLSYGRLKLLPWWDPLRGDPRFEKIVASLAPK